MARMTWYSREFNPALRFATTTYSFDLSSQQLGRWSCPGVNWRSLRTSHATWLKMAGADVKDAQAQMRALAFEHHVGHLPAVRTRKPAAGSRQTEPFSELNCDRV
jgi:hypothetical protein